MDVDSASTRTGGAACVLLGSADGVTNDTDGLKNHTPQSFLINIPTTKATCTIAVAL